MADTYGVKVKLKCQTSKSDLRNQLQTLLNGSIESSPLLIKSFKVSAPALRKALNTGFKDADVPLNLSKVTLNLSADAITNFQNQLDDKGLKLTIKEIDATQAVTRLRSQLVQMLSGLEISGVKEFLEGESLDGAKKYASNLQRLKVMLTSLNRAGGKLALFGDAEDMQGVLDLYKELSQQITDAIEASGNWENVDGLQQQLIALNRMITAHEDAARAAKKAAAEEEAAAKRAANAKKKEAEVVIASTNRRAALSSQIQTWLDRNTKATDEAKAAMRDFVTELSNPNLTAARLTEIRGEFRNLTTEMQKSGNVGKNIFETFKDGLEKFGSWSVVTKTLTTVTRYLKQMYTAVKELDSAMTELRRVTNLTEQGYAQFAKTAAASAKKIGAPVSDMINATADFARLGYDVEEAAALAEAALTYKNIGDGIDDIDQATESLISTIAAFKLSADDAMYVVDMFNEVGNSFAVSSEGIGEALIRSASALHTAGNTIQESIGLITAMNEVLQDPDSVGTTLKTLTMYLRAAETEAEEAGIATDGMASSVSTLRNELLGLTGVDIMIDDDTFKSTYQVIKEIASVWDSLTDVTKANVLDLMGGKRNANALTALIENFTTAEDAMVSATEALGSATIENWQYLDSIEGKLAVLKASFEELSASVLDSGLIKFGLDVVNVLVNILTALNDIHLLLPAITTSVSIRDYVKQIQSIKKYADELGTLFRVYSEDGVLDTDGLTSAINNQIGRCSDALKLQYKELLMNSDGFKKQSQEVQESILKLTELDKVTRTSATGMKKFGQSIANAWSSMSLVGKVSIVLTLLETAYGIYSYFSERQKEANEEALRAANEAIDTYQTQTKAINEQKETLEDLKKEYDQLSSGVDENGQSISLTKSQYSRYLQVVQQIADISPDLVSGYNEQGEAITLYANAISDAIAEQEELLKNQREILIASGKTLYNDNFKNYENAVYDSRAAFLNAVGWMAGSNDHSVEEYDNAILTAFQNIGLYYDDLGLLARTMPYDEIELFLERSGEVVQSLRESGLYTDEEIASLETAIAYAKQLDKDVIAYEENQLEYLKAYSQNQDWYESLTPASLDEFESGLRALNDPLKTYAENAAAAFEYGQRFAEGLSLPELSVLHDHFEEGVLTADEYAEQVDTVIDAWQVSTGACDEAAQALKDYYLSLVPIASTTSTATDVTASFTQQIDNITAAIETLQKSSDVLAAARDDMKEAGTLSSDTLNALLEQLNDGEDVLQYLIEENGVLKLNEKAWRERNQTIADGQLSGYKNELSSLEEVLSIADKGLDYQLPEGYETLDAVRERVALLAAAIATVQSASEIQVSASFDRASLTDVTSAIDNVASFRAAMADSSANVFDMIELAQKMADDLNSIGYTTDQRDSWVSFITGGLSSDINSLEWSETALRAYTDAMIDNYVAGTKLEEYGPEFIAALKEHAYSAIEAETQIRSLTDAIGEFNTATSLMENVRSGDMLGSLQNIMSLIESDQFSMFDFFGDQGLLRDVEIYDNIIDRLIEGIKSLAEAQEGFVWTAEFENNLRQNLHDAGIEAEETEKDVRSLTDAISEFNTATTLIENVRSGDILSTLENIMTLVASGAYVSMSDFFDEQGLRSADEIIDAIFMTLMQNMEELAAEAGIEWNAEWTITLRKQLHEAGVEAKETAEDVRSLTDAISEFNTATSLIENMRSGDVLSTLENIMTLVSSGAHVDMRDFFDEDGLKDVDDILGFIVDHLIQNMQELAEASGMVWNYDWNDSLKKQIMEAGIEAAEAAQTLEDVYANLSKTMSSAPASSDLTELTYDSYLDLIAVSSKYADAVTYQNGALVLNRDAYAKVTNEVIATTKAQALSEMIAKATSEEYIRLTNNIDNLDEQEQERLDSLNAEIAGYRVLISELDNASSAYQRFVNASTETSSDRYSAAREALEVIQNTLTNGESEIFGKVGREQYTAAMDFLIDPDIEVNTPAFDQAMETVNRYLEDGSAGVTNFYDDLVSHGFIDASGVINADMQDIASALNLNMEFLRAMFDELNQYQDADHQIKIGYDEVEMDDNVKTAEEQLKELQTQVSDFNTSIDMEHTISLDTSEAESAISRIAEQLSGILKQMDKINGKKITSYFNLVQTAGSAMQTATSYVASQISGSAAAGGTFRAAGGKTLVGELGMETVVDPAKGTWYTVGRKGAEFVNLPSGAIVLNAAQTKRLFASGSTSRRGASMALGSQVSQEILDGGLGGLSNVKLTNAINAATKAIVAASTATKDLVNSTEKATGTVTRPTTQTSPTSGSGGGSTSPSDEFEEVNKQLEHLIRHQEHLYEVGENALNFTAMEASLEEQARLYRLMMEKAQETVRAMIAAGADDTDEELQKVEESYWSAYTNLYKTIDNLNVLYVDALNSKIDGIQSGHENFAQLVSEMNETGKVSIDTFQALASQGLEYLNYLQLVDGQYVINEEALSALLATEKEQLAIEQALSYISSIRQALLDEAPEKVASLVNLTNQVGDGTWDLVYANAAMLKTLGLTDAQYDNIIHNIDMMKGLSSQVNVSLEDTSEAYADQEDALDKILDFTKKLIQYEADEKIDAINDEIDAYQKIVDLRKEALKTAKDESDYASDVAEKTKEIASLESRIAQLSLDDSREARAERASLEEELAELQGELADIQDDHAYDMQVDALDKEAESYKASREEEIAALEEQISSEEKLYQAALKRIDEGWETLYSDLIAWNTEAGSVLNNEITSNWELALEAAKRYGSYVGAIVANTGEPYAGSSGNSELPIYHSGGIVSSSGARNGEVVAVLEEGEQVLTKKQRAGLYRVVDFAKELSTMLGTTIGEIKVPKLSMLPSASEISGVSGAEVSQQNNVSFAPEINVQVSYNGTGSDVDAKAVGQKIGTVALNEMKQAFTRRGIGGIFGGMLKQ